MQARPSEGPWRPIRQVRQPPQISLKSSVDAVLALDEAELEDALDELQSALVEHREYLESVAADYLLDIPLAIRKRLSKLHATIAA